MTRCLIQEIRNETMVASKSHLAVIEVGMLKVAGLAATFPRES